MIQDPQTSSSSTTDETTENKRKHFTPLNIGFVKSQNLNQRPNPSSGEIFKQNGHFHSGSDLNKLSMFSQNCVLWSN